MIKKSVPKKPLKVLMEYGKHQTEWNTCKRCTISQNATHHVFGRGEINCDILLVGEGPGKVENIRGEAFVGKAGQYLDKCIEKANPKGLSLYFGNLVACRPCNWLGGPNRPPTLSEIRNCRPRVVELYEICKPIGIILLGTPAQDHVPWQLAHHKIRLLTYHPAWFLHIGVKLTEPLAVQYIRELAQFFKTTRTAKCEEHYARQTSKNLHTLS